MSISRRRKLIMLRMALNSILSNSAIKRGNILRKSGWFHSFGNNNFWYPKTIPSDPNMVSIGNNVTVSADVDFVTHDLIFRMTSDGSGNEKIRYHFDKIIVGDNVMIGAHSVIMYGVHIERNTIIAAGSVVTKDVKEGTIVGGNPAKVIGNVEQHINKRIQQQKSMPKRNDDIDSINKLLWEE